MKTKFWLLLETLLFLHCSSEYIRGNGTFYVDVIIPMYDENFDINYSTGMMTLAAVRYGIKGMNIVYGRHLHGYKLALGKVFVLSEGGAKLLIALRHSRFESAFVVGILPGNDALAVGAFAEIGHLPIILHGATSTYFDSFSNDCSVMLRSATPSNSYRLAVLSQLIQDLKWNFVAMIGSQGLDGHTDIMHFLPMVTEHALLAREEVTFARRTSQTEVERVIAQLGKFKNLKVLLLFTNDADSRKVLIALRNLDMQDKFLIVFVYGNTNYYEVIEGLEEIAVGSISLNYEAEQTPGFKNFVLRMNPSLVPEKHFHLFWEQVFKCRLESKILENVTAPYRKNYTNICNDSLKLSEGLGYYPNSPAQSIISAVLSGGLASALVVMNKCDKCVPCNASDPQCDYLADIKKCSLSPNATYCNFSPRHADGPYRRQLMYQLCQISINSRFVKYAETRSKQRLVFVIRNFQLKEDNEYKNEEVGHWTIRLPDRKTMLHPKEAMQFAHSIQYDLSKENITWRNNSTPHAVCSEECPPGQTKTYKSLQKFCWDCKACVKNEIVVNNTCVGCKFAEVANAARNVCLPLPERYLDFNFETYPLVMLLTGFSLFGLMTVIFVVVVFMKFNSNHVVRASGRDLSYSILAGIILMLCCPLIILRKPTALLCGVRDVLPSSSFLLCYAALSMKVARIYRIFISAKSKVTRPRLISPVSQLFILFGFTVTQFFLSGVWFISEPPGAERIVSADDNFVFYHCNGARDLAKYFFNLLPSVIFVSFCTGLAFKTRNFPKNYNEAKYIGITLYVTCIVWLLYTVILLIPDHSSFVPEYSLSIFCLCIGYITLFGLFGRKLVILFQHKPMEDHHDSLKARARSLSSRSSSHKDIPVLKADGSYM